MRLSHVTKATSPDDRAFVRVTTTVRLVGDEAFDIWFELPAEFEGELSESGNPWLLAALPYALAHGEEIVCELPVDPELLENVTALTRVWVEWYPQFRRPVVRAPAASLQPRQRQGGRTAAFFSGGIDSWFTVLRHAPEREAASIGHVDDLLTVHGFDIPVERSESFATLRDTLREAAAEMGRTIIVLRTNLRRRDTLWAHGWGWLTHGAGLAASALMLEKRFGKALIGSTHPYGALIPWGSHPMTDALLSTSGLTFKHDGAASNRVEKTALVARHPVALRHLHVCWTQSDATNCGKCAKCLRTMATLHLLDALPRGVFPTSFEPARLAEVYIENANEHEFFLEVLDLAERTGNEEVRCAMTSAIRRSSRLRPLIDTAHRFRSVPLLWRLERALTAAARRRRDLGKPCATGHAMGRES